ncbi:MAG: hypothetical protein F4Y67_08900 [Chloroflexi bacterium]|nr:hypothetical protein [Chloroflexota bacterium]
MKKNTLVLSLLAGTALTQPALAQICQNDINSGCVPGPVVEIPVGHNTETAPDATPPTRGFAVSVNGAPTVGEPRLVDLQRKADLALAEADVQVRFDGLETTRRLDAQALKSAAGDTVTFQSRLNYPAFVERGEIRIIDPNARGGAEIVEVLRIQPGGRVTARMPDGEDLVYVHRVYDAQGRFDETFALPLSARDRRDLAEGKTQEEGSSSLKRADVRIVGGAITVSGTTLPPNTRVQTLGEVVETDDKGSFAIQRFLPVGEHAVDIAASTVDLTREIEIPGAEWFYVGIVDVTLGWRDGDRRDADGQSSDSRYDRGWIAGYVRGRTVDGTEITISVDTQEEELSDIFRNLDQRDPRRLLRRLDPDDLYPTYGDDSMLVETAPTSGRFFVKVKKDGNHILWGDYKANIEGSEYIRNERTFYGAQAHAKTSAVTETGEARASIKLYGAQPDNLPQRDVFRGTGGSVYFLSRQDISLGSETITIEIRDPSSNRVVDRVSLAYGTDYNINYIQGVVRLTRPLSAYAGKDRLISTNPNGDDDVNLVVQYEWTPDALDSDSYAYGGRGEVWLSDRLRLGVTGQVEQTAIADQQTAGVDLRWEHSDRTWAEAEIARSDGPGFGSFASTDGGLTGSRSSGQDGSGNAYRFAAQTDLEESGLAVSGLIGGYFEHRDTGFTSLDYSIVSDETLWGLYGAVDASDRTRYRFYADFYENDAGLKNNEVGLEAYHQLSGKSDLSFGIEHLDTKTVTASSAGNGSRTDVALRYARAVSERLGWNVFGLATVKRNDTMERNNRIGVGGQVQLDEFLRIEGEVSGGNLGVGAQALITYDDQQGKSTYFGYTLDPDRTALNSVLNNGEGGQFVAGSQQKLSDNTRVYVENRYELFSTGQNMTGTYGVDYSHSEYTDYSAVLEVGQVDDPVEGDFRRQAISLGYVYDNATTATEGRLEYRRERGLDGNANRNSDTILFLGSLRHKLSKSRRVLASLDVVHTNADKPALTDTDYAEMSVGYAYRPIRHDRLNILARYRFVYDEYGQVITSGSDTDVRGPLQHSHILSIDAEYDGTQQWSLGGKIGYRFSETAPNGTSDFISNNAWLLVANTRYHVTHKWDLLAEFRMLTTEQADTQDAGMLLAAYRHVGDNAKIGLGYNLTSFSDDLADLTYDDGGLFVNLIAKF